MLTSTPTTPLGRVISVRGSQARVGLLATDQNTLSSVRATVGQFFGIRTATTILVAIITEVTRENLPAGENYVASASVDLLGEIGTGVDGKFQRHHVAASAGTLSVGRTQTPIRFFLGAGDSDLGLCNCFA